MNRILTLGSRGSDVVKLQEALGIKADGIFGRDTRRALIDFQKKNNLTPDGIAGNNTFSALFSAPSENKTANEKTVNTTSVKTQKLVDVAKTIINTYRKNNVKYSQTKRQFGADAKYSDCSATVATILNLANYGHLLKSTNTRGMRAEIAAKGGEFRKDNPKPGDIMMWGGHVTLVVEVKNNTVHFAHMGNSGARIGSARLTNNTLNIESTWGSGGFIGFWTII
jgi:peptidoglycan hydrolase-like protein with peptidoglycan-binding domain